MACVQQPLQGPVGPLRVGVGRGLRAQAGPRASRTALLRPPATAFNFRKAPPPIPPGSQAPPRISITAQSSTDSAHESFTAAEGPARRCSSADGLDGPAMGARTLELAPVPPRASPKPPTLIIKTIPGREELRSLARQRKWRPSIGVQVWNGEAPTRARTLAGWGWGEGPEAAFWIYRPSSWLPLSCK